MNGTKLLTIAVGALVLVGGLAVAGTAMPADAANANETAGEAAGNAPVAGDDVDTNETAAADSVANDTERTAAADDRPGAVGPPGGMPEQAPDHVSEIHNTIESFLGGGVDSLGDALSDVAGPGDAADDAANEDADDADGDDDAANEDADDADGDDEAEEAVDDEESDDADDESALDDEESDDADEDDEEDADGDDADEDDEDDDDEDDDSDD